MLNPNIQAAAAIQDSGLKIQLMEVVRELKLVSAIFHFSSNDNPRNHEKWFLFHLKISFHSQYIKIFVFPSTPLFLQVSVISCLDKNLITYFVWHLEKEKRYNIETLPIEKVLNKGNFHGKTSRKYVSKASPRPFSNFGN